jgi:hypothetical protein
MAAQAAQQPGFGQAIGQGQQAVQMAQQAAQQPGFAQGIGALYGGAQQGTAAAQQPGFAQGIGAALSAADQARMAAAQPGFNQAQQTGMQSAQAAMAAANQPGLQGGVNTQLAAAQQAAMAAQQPGFASAQQSVQQGIGQLGGAAQAYNPASAQGFMNPYQQQVIDATMRQMDRQNMIAGQGQAAQAVRAGAFGGEREGVQRAEMQRNLLEQKSNTIANLLSQGYSQAQAQSMAAFEQQQQRQASTAQGIGQLGCKVRTGFGVLFGGLSQGVAGRNQAGSHGVCLL